MLRLYTKAVLVIALAAVLTLISARLWLDASSEDVSLRLVGGHAVLHANAIAHTPPAERRGVVKSISKTLGYSVQMEVAGNSSTLRAEWRRGLVYVVAPVDGTPGQLAFGPLPEGRIASLSSAVGLAMVFALILAWLTVMPHARQLCYLREVASKMGKGDFGQRVAEYPEEALDVIGSALNRLADRMNQLLSDERDLLRTVAHEVRAPISRMHFRVDKISGKVDASLQNDASGLVSDLRQVDCLFEELLTYVAFDEFDYERPALQTVRLNVESAVSRLVKEVSATVQGIDIEVTGGEAACIFANEKLFDRAVTNLLLNAMAYGGPKIVIVIREFPESCVIDVQDSGPGIPEGDRPKVIKPFVRLAKKKTRGTGLGLAIVSRIMSLHQGRLHILNAPGGGASIQLVWQNAKPKQRTRWMLGQLGPKG